MEKQTTVNKSERSYNFFLNIGKLQELYPHLTGDWEKDKAFWCGEHEQQIGRAHV